MADRRGLAPPRCVAAQGAALADAGRVHVMEQLGGDIWIGGEVTEVVSGIVTL